MNNNINNFINQLYDIIFNIINEECNYRQRNSLAPVVCSDLIIQTQLRSLVNLAIENLIKDNKIKATQGINLKLYSVC